MIEGKRGGKLLRAVTLTTTPLGNNQYDHRCPRCGWHTTTEGNDEITHECQQPERISRLGDRVEAALGKAGITQERWKAFKKQFGLPATCNCTARKEYLNRMGDEFGEAVNKFKTLMGW